MGRVGNGPVPFRVVGGYIWADGLLGMVDYPFFRIVSDVLPDFQIITVVTDHVIVIGFLPELSVERAQAAFFYAGDIVFGGSAFEALHDVRQSRIRAGAVDRKKHMEMIGQNYIQVNTDRRKIGRERTNPIMENLILRRAVGRDDFITGAGVIFQFEQQKTALCAERDEVTAGFRIIVVRQAQRFSNGVIHALITFFGFSVGRGGEGGAGNAGNAERHRAVPYRGIGGRDG